MTEPPRPVGIELPESYALERELGRGGMATVYLARDRKHNRLAARLQHPHILTGRRRT